MKNENRIKCLFLDIERNFRIFGPDETLSNRLEAIFEATNRQWEGATIQNDEFLEPSHQGV